MVPDLVPPAVKAGRRDVRRRNKWLLLHLIQTDGPSSQAELARRSGLSPAAVSGILQPLIRKRILVQERKSTSGMGRKATILGFNPRTTLTAGVCIDQEECEVALVDLSARVIDRASATYPRYTEPHEVVALAASRIEALVERNRVDLRALIGVGVAIPGLIDSGSGLVWAAANLRWHNVQLRALFEQRLQLPARVEHLGRAKARAEAIWGQGMGYRNFVCLEIGSGIGAGVMADGQILRGAGASAGEVGHTLFDPRGPRCACGLNGCWEVFCASPAIRRRLGEHLALDGGSGSALSPAATLRELGQAAEQGDPVARRVVAETAELLARGLGSIIWNFDPGLIILSGPVVRDCPSLVEATRTSLGVLKAVRKFDVPLLAATQEPDAGVIAASAIVSFRHLEELAKGDAAVSAVNLDGEALLANLAHR
jgi:predicted NBD/HSP70 family sugar kinase